MTTTDKRISQFPWDFFALTFGFSWLVWLPAILGNLGIISLRVDAVAGPISILGLFGPMFGACVLIYRDQGWAGVKRHLGRLLNVRIRAGWWAVILLLPLGIQAAAHFFPLVTHEQVPAPLISSLWAFLFTLVMVTLVGGGQEELGWRGYALDRIQTRFTALNSSVILGTFWACWHIPLWFMPGTSLGSTPFGAFVVACAALSVILTWIYNNTGKNMVAAILTHGMVNAVNPLFPVIMARGTDQHVYVYWAITYAVAAILITLIWGPTTLSGRTTVQA
ncbi:MAG: type II CAAX endopeptidase family protein [Bacteroidota bacterium]